MVEGSGLLIRRTERFPGFESLSLCQRRVEVAPRLVWVSKSHMMRSDVAITTKGSMQVCRHVFVVSAKGRSESVETVSTYTLIAGIV